MAVIKAVEINVILKLVDVITPDIFLVSISLVLTMSYQSLRIEY